MNYISPQELKEKLDNNEGTILLDIREKYELDICNIGGLHIPMAEVAERVNEIDVNNEIVVLCRSGRRAVAVANLLTTDFDVQNVRILEGGILAWIEDVDTSLEVY
ncbi:MAG: rhodanese-like domain-containing protein [Crocinitomicaceae bacterium]|nr:rhodanese-like domain-containing protein [Crocinitomicaceae bacterium]